MSKLLLAVLVVGAIASSFLMMGDIQQE